MGRDLEYLEQILGPMNYGTAARCCAGSGALVGALIVWIFGLVNWIEPVISALVLAGYGGLRAVVGALFGLLVHALQRGQRDFHPLAGCGPSITTSSRTWRWPIVPLQLLAGGNRRNRRWRQR